MDPMAAIDIKNNLTNGIRQHPGIIIQLREHQKMHAVQPEKFKLFAQLHFHSVGDFTEHGVSGASAQRQIDVGKISQMEA